MDKVLHFEAVTCPYCGSENIKHYGHFTFPGVNGYCEDCQQMFYDYRLEDFRGNRGLIQCLMNKIELLESRVEYLEKRLEEHIYDRYERI